MSRPTTGQNRPTHIPLPTGGFAGRSPNGSPLNGPASPTSPRNSFLPSFMRTRSRAATLSNNRAASPSVEAANPIPANTVARGQSGQDQAANGGSAAGASINRSVSTPLSAGGVLASAASDPPVASTSANQTVAPSGAVKTHRIRLVPALENSRSLAFDPVVRELMSIYVPPGTSPSVAAASITNTGPAINGRPPALLLKIGRFTEKNPSTGAAAAAVAPASGSGPAGAASGSGATGGVGPTGTASTLTIAGGGGDVCSNKVAFKSKVVSRAHAEIWCENGGKFYIRDTSSSSGTFLNHIRLSSPNTESRPTMLNDGDILQLGVDYQGGHEDMFRCVKMRVEVGREWQRAANEFNTNALKQLKALGGGPSTPTKAPDSPVNGSAKKGKTNVTDCCICLFSVTVCQSLFIAPCSHVFHYKCIRPLLLQHHPGFSCPLCRTFANLEEDVETEDAWEVASRRASVLSRKPSNHSIRLPPTTNRAPAHPGSDAPDGQPSTSVGFGPAGASVDELLAADNASSSSESAAMAGSATLHRQHTAVQDTSAASGDIDMPQALHEADQGGGEGTLTTHANPFLVPAGGGAQPRSIPVPPVDPFAGPMSDAQTPMNDTFLSTLAPSVHQRLDLANQIAEVGRAAELLEEEPAGGDEPHASRRNSDDEWMDVDRDGREGTVDMDESTRVPAHSDRAAAA